MLIDTLDGLPPTATAYFVLVASVAVPLNMYLVSKYAKPPDCAACLGRGKELEEGEKVAKSAAGEGEKAE